MSDMKNSNSRKRTLKQNLALAGVFLLAAMYLTALISAFFKSEAAQALFRASIACTILVPIFLYVFLMAAKAVRPSKSPVIDSIVLDVGNVLVGFPWIEYCRTLPFSEGFLDRFLSDRRCGEIWAEFDRGVKTFEEVRQMYYDAFPDHQADIDLFLDNIDQCMDVYSYTESFISELKRHGYGVYILSNWSDFLYRRQEAKGDMAFADLTDGAFWSYRHHLMKPDPAFFQKLIDTYQIDPKRSVFIDDMPKNTAAASELGFLTILFKDYQDMLRKLGSLGVKI